jgi:V/A-type H+-transporting ATPase subunit D
MALKFQYNKTFLQQLNKELKVRETALPTLQAKEAALRLEVRKAKDEVHRVEENLKKITPRIERTYALWNEYPADILSIKNVVIEIKKIAGVKTPILERIDFSIDKFSLFNLPAWVPSGLELLKEMVLLHIEKQIAEKKVSILEYARKKTTQKVNLYEKVQIPDYKESILKIKRFLEDKENLEKSSQKILKARMAQAEARA